MNQKQIIYVFFALIFLGCHSHYQVTDVKNSQTRIKGDSLKLIDSSVYYTILPYKLKLDSQVNQVIGYTNQTLMKEKPEGTLNNMVADAAMSYATQYYSGTVDLCVLNYGGIRLPSLSQGNITAGKIFELMPFDNEIVVLEINGKVLYQLLDLVAANGGWPISGASMDIHQNKLSAVRFKRYSEDSNFTYTLITSDYLANGGDNASFLLNATKRVNLNYKVRDAITDYVKLKSPLDMKVEGRIVIKD